MLIVNCARWFLGAHQPGVVGAALPGGGGEVLPSKTLLGLCRWMGSHFHNWTDYNGVTFLVVTKMRSHIFVIFGIKKVLLSRDLKIGRFAIKLNSVLEINEICTKVTEIGSIVDH